MVIAVTLNPCVDRTVWLGELSPGGHNRADGSRSDVSGKGINVNLALHNLGVPTACLSLEHETDGDRVRELMESLGIPFVGIPVPGALRLNLKLTETATGRMTEINERGAPVEAAVAETALERLGELLSEGDLLVVSGSAPPGIPEDVYARMISLAQGRGVRTLLDAQGELLRRGLEARSWCVKPNRFELEQLTGEHVESLERAATLCRGLNDKGVELVCLSLGRDGALLSTSGGVWFSPGLDIEVKGAQGAGDSMVAGLCAAAVEGLPPREMLRYAVAAAHASLLREGTLLCERGCFEELLGKLPVSTL